jgi:hypothetical protein
VREGDGFEKEIDKEQLGEDVREKERERANKNERR